MVTAQAAAERARKAPQAARAGAEEEGSERRWRPGKGEEDRKRLKLGAEDILDV